MNLLTYCDSMGLWNSSRNRLPRVTGNLVTNIGLVVLALSIATLYWPVTRWTLDKFLQSSLHWHWFVAALSVVCALRANTHRFQPGVNNGATLLLLLCTVLEVANQRALQIQLFSAVLLIISLHAYTGHLIPKNRWGAMKWPMVVGVALLPLDFYLDPYLGYPLRLFTANIARLVLQGFGFEVLSSQSILLLENRASVVDLGCSGINSLWAGAVFYLLLSWMTQLSVGIRWWLLGLLLVVLLLSANVVRIVVIVILDLYGFIAASEIAHTSLGALGFAVSIFIVWKIADGMAKQKSPNSGQVHESGLKWRWPLMPTIMVLLIAAAVPTNDQDRPPIDYANVEMPRELLAKRIDLTGVEQQFFKGNHAKAVKYQLGARELNQSVVLVTSNWWKAQHKPEHCLQSMGFSILRSRVLTLPSSTAASINAVSVLSMVDAHQQPYTAVYWFQSADLLTPDHYRRMADTIRNPNRTWTMTSLLLRGEYESDEIIARVAPIQQTIAANYEE